MKFATTSKDEKVIDIAGQLLRDCPGVHTLEEAISQLQSCGYEKSLLVSWLSELKDSRLAIYEVRIALTNVRS